MSESSSELLKRAWQALREEVRLEIEADVRDEIANGIRRAGPSLKKNPRVSSAFLEASAGIKRLAKKPAPSRQSGRRDPEEIAKVRKRVVDWVKRNPGKGTKDICKALGLTLADVQFPMAKAKEAGEIKQSGERSAATYA